jgi:hypothetical protein
MYKRSKVVATSDVQQQQHEIRRNGAREERREEVRGWGEKRRTSRESSILSIQQNERGARE